MAGRALTEDADSEIAIMMVEAGGTEKSWSYYDAGAPKVTEEVLAVGPRSGQDRGSASPSTSSAAWSRRTRRRAARS